MPPADEVRLQEIYHSTGRPYFQQEKSLAKWIVLYEAVCASWFFMRSPLDDLDRCILTALARDARVSWKDLATEAGVSAPTIRDRVKRLQDTGVIQGFAVEIAPAALGFSLEAVVRFRPLPGKRHVLEAQIQETDRIVQCDKVTGEDGFVARILLKEIGELDPLLETFSRMATTNTSIVKSSPVRMRPPPF